jgi:hypothetical protein
MNKILLACAALLLLISSCKDKKDSPAPGDPHDTLMTAYGFVQSAGPQLQSFYFNTAELPKTFVFNGGTRVTLNPGAFTKNGVQVTGELRLEVLEFYKRSEILKGGANTNLNTGEPLASDGFLYLAVLKDGEKVDKYLSAPMHISMPTERTGVTYLWAGNLDQRDGSAENFAWRNLDSMQGDNIPVQAFNGNFDFDFRQLGWVNCDVLYQPGVPNTTLRVQVNNNPGTFASFRAFNGETFVFFCPADANVAVQLYSPDGPNRVKSYDMTMPIGASGTLLSFAITDDKFYLAKKQVTIGPDMLETLDLAETTEAVLQAELEAMDN